MVSRIAGIHQVLQRDQRTAISSAVSSHTVAGVVPKVAKKVCVRRMHKHAQRPYLLSPLSGSSIINIVHMRKREKVAHFVGDVIRKVMRIGGAACSSAGI